MAIAGHAAARDAKEVAVGARRHGRWSFDRVLPPLLLSPSLIALGIFVYGFIAATVWVSLSNWRSLRINLSLRDPLLATYGDLFTDRRFQTDLRNTLVFTILFLLASVGSGLILAILLDQKVFGRAVFRNLFLFPYALSFITTGVAWRWIFNPDAGVNKLFELTGINWVLDVINVGPIRQSWLTSASVLGDIPMVDAVKAQIGLPVAMLPVIIAAVWQLSPPPSAPTR